MNAQTILAFGSNKLGMDIPLSIPVRGCEPSWVSYGEKHTHATGELHAGLVASGWLQAKLFLM